MSYSLRIHPAAQQDVDDYAHRIAASSVPGAHNWLDAFEEAVSRIKSNPFAYGLAPEDVSFCRGLRQTTFSTRHGLVYRAVYLVDEDYVTILRVRGWGQDLLEAGEVPEDA